MTFQDIAALIAAIAFAVFVCFACYALLRLAALIGQVQKSVVDIAAGAGTTVEEATAALVSAKTQLERVDTVTTSAAQVAQDVSAMSTLVSATLGGPLVKVAAFNHAVRTVLRRDGSRAADED